MHDAYETAIQNSRRKVSVRFKTGRAIRRGAEDIMPATTVIEGYCRALQEALLVRSLSTSKTLLSYTCLIIAYLENWHLVTAITKYSKVLSRGRPSRGTYALRETLLGALSQHVPHTVAWLEGEAQNQQLQQEGCFSHIWGVPLEKPLLSCICLQS